MKEPTLELHSRAASNLEAHHCVNGPDTGSDSKCKFCDEIDNKTKKTITVTLAMTTTSLTAICDIKMTSRGC